MSRRPIRAADRLHQFDNRFIRFENFAARHTRAIRFWNPPSRVDIATSVRSDTSLRSRSRLHHGQRAVWTAPVLVPSLRTAGWPVLQRSRRSKKAMRECSSFQQCTGKLCNLICVFDLALLF